MHGSAARRRAARSGPGSAAAPRPGVPRSLPWSLPSPRWRCENPTEAGSPAGEIPSIGCAPMRTEGAAALVAGGASGLGEATARMLVESGATVTIADLNAERGEELASELGSAATFIEADVTDAEAVSAAVEHAAAANGGLRVSVCCAGIGWAERVAHKGGPHNLELFAKVIEVNLIGTFNVLRLAAASMSENDPVDEGERGVCVNTASIAAYDGQIGQAAYSASKGGIVGMTLPAARDLAPRGIRVVTVAPGL